MTMTATGSRIVIFILGIRIDVAQVRVNRATHRDWFNHFPVIPQVSLTWPDFPELEASLAVLMNRIGMKACSIPMSGCRSRCLCSSSPKIRQAYNPDPIVAVLNVFELFIGNC
jgi:hypothetical protein